RGAGNAALFDSLKELLPGEPDAPSQKDIAAHLGMTENAVRQAFYRFRQHYQSLLREEIAHTVATPGDIEDELRHLIAVVRAYRMAKTYQLEHGRSPIVARNISGLLRSGRNRGLPVYTTALVRH